MNITDRPVVIVTLLLGLLASCSSEATREQNTARSSAPAASAPTPAAERPLAAPSASGSGLATVEEDHPMKKVADMAPLNDDQIAAVVVALNQGEIDQAEAVRSKGTDPEVKKFADHMVDEHGKWLKDANDLAKKSNLRPADNALSKELGTDSAAAVKMLSNETADKVDKDYIDGQVKGHEGALDVLDMRLLKDVKSAGLKKALEDVRPKVASHLAMAKTLQSLLANRAKGLPPAPTEPAKETHRH